MIRDFISGKNPAYMECNLNLVPVQLVAQGHLAAVQKGVIGGRYILGQDNYKLSELLTMIENQLGKSMPKTKIPYLAALASAKAMEWKAKFDSKPPRASVEGVRLAAANMHFDCTKSRQELGLVPGSLPEALIQAARWLQDQKLLK
jgi:dihydroflavonol-4-reductase